MNSASKVVESAIIGQPQKRAKYYRSFGHEANSFITRSEELYNL